MPVNAQVQLEKSYQAWQLLGGNRFTYEQFIVNMSEADSNVSYRYKCNINNTRVTERFNSQNIT